MGKVSRLTHKQIEAAIKRDELRDFIGEAQHWVKSHLENVLIGLVVLALLIFGGVYLMNSRADDAIKASIQLSAADQQFSRALSSGDAQAFDQAKAGYDQVRAGFDGRPEAAAAELGLANIAFSQGKLDDAKSAYERFIASHSSSPLEPLASSSLAATLEAMNKPKEAADAYLALASRRPTGAVTAQSYFDAARCLEAIKDSARLKQVVSDLDKLDAEKGVPAALKGKLQALKKRV